MSVCLSAACLYISVYTPVRLPPCLSVCHTSVFCRHIRNFYCATHMHSADYAVTTCLSVSVYLLCSYATISLVQLYVRLSFCCMFVYISLYTCPFARLFVHLSHVGILSTPLNISAIFTARRICIARTMQRQHVCPTTRASVYLTLRPSVIRQASRPAQDAKTQTYME